MKPTYTQVSVAQFILSNSSDDELLTPAKDIIKRALSEGIGNDIAQHGAQQA